MCFDDKLIMITRATFYAIFIFLLNGSFFNMAIADYFYSCCDKQTSLISTKNKQQNDCNISKNQEKSLEIVKKKCSHSGIATYLDSDKANDFISSYDISFLQEIIAKNNSNLCSKLDKKKDIEDCDKYAQMLTMDKVEQLPNCSTGENRFCQQMNNLLHGDLTEIQKIQDCKEKK